MEIYLPIAEQSMNVFVLFGLGGAAGLLAGMFGVGGGFLATPMLIFVGIPPTVAVASQANQVVANSISSLQVQWRRGNVDLRMGLVLLLGGMLGSSAGVWLFTWLKRIGQIDFVIAVMYVLLLSSIGLLMLAESLRTYFRAPAESDRPARQAAHSLSGPPPAVEDAVLQVEALYQRLPADRAGLRDRYPVGDPGRRRRLRAGPRDDLPARHADQRRDRHLELPDPVRGGERHLPAGGNQRHGGRRAGAAADPGRRGRRPDRLTHRGQAAGRRAARPHGGSGAGRGGPAAGRIAAHPGLAHIPSASARCCREGIRVGDR